MSKAILFFCGIFFFVFCNYSFSQDTLSYWGLNETSGTSTKEAITNSDYTIHSKWATIERVPGIKQNALRTDGYTFWIDGTVTNAYPVDSFSVSAWVALETYPVTKAAIWSYFDAQANRGAYIGINKFGNITVNFTVNTNAVTFTSTVRAEHYKWNFVVLNVDAVNGNCNVYLNGQQIINQSFATGPLGWPTTKTFLARTAATETTQTIFPINYLNGILDEIVVRKKRFSAAQILQEYNLLNPTSAPDLTTPATRFANDFHRPKYHAIPNNGWANESHGLLHFNGVYHLFYQKNGNGPFFSQQNWGHLTSTDLVNWQEKQVALFPQPGWESVGNWSGHCVLDNAGVPTIIYTGVDGVKAGIGSAQSTGSLLNWNRNAANPLLPASPVTPANRDFRDPYVFKEGNIWYMIVGSGLQSPLTGTGFLYKSTDLTAWQYVKPLFIDNINNAGIFWEMPVFWKFGNKYMLLVNKTPQGGDPARAFYWVGNFTNEIFVPTTSNIKNLDIINSLLSPSVNIDDQNRVTAIGIIPDLLPASEQYNNGWANLFSLPRVWQMQNDSLFQSPHPNLDATRGTLTTLTNIAIKPGGSNYINLKGIQAELKTSIDPGTATKVGFILQKNENNIEYTKIYYDYTIQSFVVDRTKASSNANTPRDIQTEPFALPSGKPIDWQIYIDGSVIEVFINNKWAFATRVYPTSAFSNIIDVFCEGGNASAASFQAWSRGDLTAIAIPPLPVNKTLKVWPMPANDKCYIQLPGNTIGKVTLTLYNANGKKVKQSEQQITASTQFITYELTNAANLKIPSGIYFCNINVNGNENYRIKLDVAR